MLILELALREIFKEALKSFAVTAASVAATKGVEHLYETRVKQTKKPKAASKKAKSSKKG